MFHVQDFRPLLRLVAFPLGLALLSVCCLPARADLPALEVQVRVHNQHILVQARVPLPVPRNEAWAVLTDYDHMAGFLPNLEEARVVSERDHTLVTYQRGTARYGLFSYDFEITREVLLSPGASIRSHLLSGNMKQFDAEGELVEEQGQLWLLYHSDSVPDFWLLAFVVRPFVEHEVTEQFAAMQREMARRHR